MPADSHAFASNPLRKSARLLILLLGTLLILAACGNGGSGSDEEGHQFATERRPTEEPTASLESDDILETIEPTADPTAVTVEGLVVRGAPQFTYFETDSGLMVYDAVSRTFTTVNIPADMPMLDHASSPTGDRVGVLGLSGSNVVVQFFGADGEPLGDAIILPVYYWPMQSSPEASPNVAQPNASQANRLSVSWVPQGNAVVVSGPGVLQRVSMSGQIMPISRTGLTGSVTQAIWSPMDSQVAIRTQLMDGNHGVFLLDSGSADAIQVDSLQLEPGQGISNLQWLPSGLGLVYVAGNQSEGDLMNGQLYVYQFGDAAPTLVATSGQGGPAATISHAVVSPDGQSVAYAVMVRDGESWHLHSLWVRPVRGGTGLSIPMQSGSPIISIQWTAEGLVSQQANGSITVIDDNLQPRPLGEEPVATPVATPDSPQEFDATPRG